MKCINAADDNDDEEIYIYHYDVTMMAVDCIIKLVGCR